jgi:hypothetical protein
LPVTLDELGRLDPAAADGIREDLGRPARHHRVRGDDTAA